MDCLFPNHRTSTFELIKMKYVRSSENWTVEEKYNGPAKDIKMKDLINILIMIKFESDFLK